MPLDAGRSDRDLTPDRPVLAGLHAWEEPREGRQLGQVTHGAAHSGARGLVLGPDQVGRLARDGQPAARFADDLDQDSTFLRLAGVSGLEEARDGACRSGDDEYRPDLEKDVDDAPGSGQGVPDLRRDGE
jgi:hypothetical protein